MNSMHSIILTYLFTEHMKRRFNNKEVEQVTDRVITVWLKNRHDILSRNKRNKQNNILGNFNSNLMC